MAAQASLYNALKSSLALWKSGLEKPPPHVDVAALKKKLPPLGQNKAAGWKYANASLAALPDALRLLRETRSYSARRRVTSRTSSMSPPRSWACAPSRQPPHRASARQRLHPPMAI